MSCPRVLFAISLPLLACATACRRPAIPSPAVVVARRGPVTGEVRYLKGQLHAHTGNSGDSHTPPADVVRWYDSHGFDFVVLTDHNHVTEADSTERLLVIPGVELTQNLSDCDPPPEPGRQCLLHMNVLFARPGPVSWPALDGNSRLAIYFAELEMARALGGIAQLNHPNFHYGADASLITRLVARGLRLLEVENQSLDVNNGGDLSHGTTQALWDGVLAGADTPVFATASDDAHHYYDAGAVSDAGRTAYTGDRGFVMVRARKDAASIRAALERGDFYASSGIRLSTAQVVDGELVVELEPPAPHGCHVDFIGNGHRLHREYTSTRASFPLAKAPAGWLRVVAGDREGHAAWSQPVRIAPAGR